VTGRLVPRLDTQALARALREMSADPARLLEMGAAARTRAERLLTWARSAERLERLYAGLAAVPETRCRAPIAERARSIDVA
jgi:glycosyltransferase involved in cell wall biosynthesis